MAATLCGCTLVRIQGAKNVKVSDFIGVADVRIVPGRHPVVIKTNGVGIVLSGRTAVFGWLDQRQVVFPDPSICSVIIESKSTREIKAVSTILRQDGKRLSNICMSGE